MLARRVSLALLCAVALFSGAMVLTSAPAEAQAAPAAGNNKEEARKAYGEAKKALEAENYEAALPLFQKADSLYPGAAPKYNVALCLDKLGRAEEAVGAYRTFIDSNPGTKYADRVALAEKRIGELQASLPATVVVSVSPPDAPGVQISVDGVPQPGAELKMPPGEHTIVVTAEGYQPVTEVVNVTGGEQRQLPLTLLPAAPPPLAPLPPPPVEGPTEEAESSKIPAYVTLGIAGAGVILGTVFGIQALSAKGDFDDDPTTDNADRAERAALIADMSFGVALTFGITGAVLLFSDDEGAAPEEEASAKPVLAPFAGPKGGGMAATWTF